MVYPPESYQIFW